MEKAQRTMLEFTEPSKIVLHLILAQHMFKVKYISSLAIDGLC